MTATAAATVESHDTDLDLGPVGAPEGAPVGALPPRATLRGALLTASMLLPVAALGTTWSDAALADTAAAAEYGRPAADAGSVGQAAQLPAAPAVSPAPAVVGQPAAATPAAPTPATAPAGGASTAQAPTPSPVPVSSAPPSLPPTASAVDVLVQQAQFWLDQFQPDKAVEALNRAMQLDPHNPDVFAVLAQLQADSGNRPAATASLGQLRLLRPGDPRIPKIEQAIRTGVINPEELAHARELAQQAHGPEAVAAYQRIFKGGPPPDRLAIEYYQTLAGVPGGWEQARAGLGQMVIENPSNLKAQLAYAELLTYQEPSRLEGIQRLTQLVANPSVGAEADTALHQAMLWLPANAASVPALQTFLQTHPNAADVAQRLADAQNPRNNFTDPVGQARQAGFDALNAGKLDVATQIFESVLNTNPRDPDALGGLGIVRLRQGKRDEAKTLLSQAIELDPEHRDRWDQALQGATANYAGKAGPNLSGEYAQVRVLADRGDYAQAESLLNRVTGGKGNPGMSLMLGDVEARAGHLPESEASYRTALRGQPNNASALIGLAQVLNRQGRTQEADELFARAEASGNRTLVARARAEELRQRAEAVSDPLTRAAMYRAANAADPSNPWIRLEFARSLVAIGQKPEARALMLDASGGGDNLKAALIYAQEQNDGTAASALLARIPARNRTAELRQFAAQAQDQVAINNAIALYRANPSAGRQRLLAMAAAPDPTGNRTQLVVHALISVGDTAGARQAVNTAIAVNPRPTPDARLALAGALLSVGETSQSSMMLAEATSLTPDQRVAAQGIRTGIAVRSSDQLNERGQQAAAFDQLAPVLEQQPNNPDANMALARLYQGADKPKQALAVSLNLLRQDPNNLDARKQAVEAAIAAQEFGTADRLAREATQGQPNEVKSWLISAEVAKARGDNSRAVHDLMTARGLRRQQIGSNGSTRLEPPPHPRVELTQSTGRAGPTPLTGDAYDGAPLPSVAGPSASIPDSSPPLQVTPAPVAPLPPNRGVTASTDTMPRSSYRGVPLNTTPAPLAPPINPYPVAPAAPMDLTQQDDGLTNPFRRPGMAVQTGQPYINNTTSSDPLISDIDRQIATLQQASAPTFEAGFALRERTGTGGQDRLTELMAPIEATFSPGGGPGTIKLQATPTYLDSGKATSAGVAQLIGTNPAFSVLTPLGYTLPVPKSTEDGVGLDAAFMWRWVSVDVGSTPIGFTRTNVVGGLELYPAIGVNSHLRLTAERRAVTDSLLSYAGQVDPNTGYTWGAVTRNRFHGQFETGIGRLNLYAGAGYSIYQGDNVASNHEFEAGAGGAYQVYKDPTNEVTVGLDLVYFGFDNNQRHFTYGYGGYFSPQSYYAALVPVNYTAKDDDFTFNVGGSLGVQTFHEAASNVFPSTQSAGQALLVAEQGLPGATSAVFPGQSQSGLTGGAHGGIDYLVNPNLHVGANASVQHSGVWTETNALAYLRYTFAPPGSP